MSITPPPGGSLLSGTFRMSEAAVPIAPCSVLVASLDFANKVETTCSFAEAFAEMKAGRFVWIDIDATDLDEARKLLMALKVIGEETIDTALKHEPSTQL